MPRKEITLKQAVTEVMQEDPRTREPKYDWLLIYEVLKKLGFNLSGRWDWNMPQPESITRCRRQILDTEGRFMEEAEILEEKNNQDEERRNLVKEVLARR